MDTYFIRHTTLSVSSGTLRKLFNSNRIAIHYPWDKHGNSKEDSRSTKPDDYVGGAKRAVKAFAALAASGGFVCAYFRDLDEVLIGKVMPRTKIRLVSAAWDPPQKDGRGRSRPAILKTLRLTGAKQVSKQDIRFLFPFQPRQGTVMRWPAVGDRIARVLEKRRIVRDWKTLEPEQLEVMCAEFMRLKLASSLGLPRLRHLLMPVGRTRRDIDIDGIAERGEALLSQVTGLSLGNAENKLSALRAYVKSKRTSKMYLVLFCDCPEVVMQDRILCVPISKVFSAFLNSPGGKEWFVTATRV